MTGSVSAALDCYTGKMPKLSRQEDPVGRITPGFFLPPAIADFTFGCLLQLLVYRYMIRSIDPYIDVYDTI
jgi:hypothetical protein